VGSVIQCLSCKHKALNLNPPPKKSYSKNSLSSRKAVYSLVFDKSAGESYFQQMKSADERTEIKKIGRGNKMKKECKKV
jgi:hypothetical protein